MQALKELEMRRQMIETKSYEAGQTTTNSSSNGQYLQRPIFLSPNPPLDVLAMVAAPQEPIPNCTLFMVFHSFYRINRKKVPNLDELFWNKIQDHM